MMYMKRALELAALGREWVSPNPMVGCVIVHNDKIIGEGFHRKYGQPHAEVNAVDSVEDKSLLSESTVYVTLEPCAHFGKTPPCAELLIKHKVKKVVVCNLDPFPQVAGKGITMLKNAGIDVEVGLLQEEGEELNKRFFKRHRTGLPYVILKWAESKDGFISAEGGKPIKISHPITDIQVHRWRAEEDAILIGKNTADLDNPQLNVRYWTEDKQPKPIILGQPTIQDLRAKGAKIFPNGKNLTEILRQLAQDGIQSILVEGGTKIHTSFIEEGLFDEIRVIQGDIEILNGVKAPQLPDGLILTDHHTYRNDHIKVYRSIPTLS
jgi:diaminohydroxyphosphoribosylaminopyrimidine deaminase/5-amino-6-(5-phosphoribosylamino)uracil reductase